jgi:hypothetical protein
MGALARDFSSREDMGGGAHATVLICEHLTPGTRVANITTVFFKELESWQKKMSSPGKSNRLKAK